ncbi:unnamed protein product [Clonostachys byssicola]|uniref:Uncharacterized protein n=1 Tax=Clonostachys byssicola TaxID=160290 RepID=A0A9N9UYR1_9HYPO|nr:unnamed protein product [Clonostachys byssicola]
MRIQELLSALFELAAVASASSYHLRHVLPSYFKLRDRGQADSPCIPRMKQSIVGVTVLLALWVLEASCTLVLRVSSEWVYIYSWALRIYTQHLMSLVSRFVLPVILLAQIELTTALRYPSDYIKGDEKKGANRNAVHRASLLAFKCVPLLELVRLVAWFYSMHNGSAYSVSCLIEFGTAGLLFLLAALSYVNYLTAKDKTLRDAPRSLAHVYALTFVRHLFDLVLCGVYFKRSLVGFIDIDTSNGDALGSVFIAWTAVGSIYLIHQVFSLEVDNFFWHERPAYLGREALKEKAWRF